uniref:Glycosyltransferase family 92 protein n=1 Tax=Caenorhabditis tropicalis TaxID=1561998 RepID=A0A1I7V039_9PELO
MIHFHWTWRQHEGCHVITASEKIGYIRHYRTTSSSSLRGNWFNLMKPYQITKMDERFTEKLKMKVLEKVKYIYKLHPVYCSSIDQKVRNTFTNDLHCV